VSSHFNDATLAGQDLVKAPAVFQFDRNHLVTDACFFISGYRQTQ